MTLMSTGSGEVMSVSSILVYDIYKIYINPFRYYDSFEQARAASVLFSYQTLI